VDAGPETATGPAARSIAVLPFINMSSDEEQEWFSDGLTEEILNALARTPDLLVAARTSSFKYKNSTEDIPTIANALGVAHVLEGSVRSGGGRLRVTAQLIRAIDGFHLWSQNYDRSPEDVIDLQEEVAIEIATALETAMDPEALAKMVSAGTSSVPAFNAYLQGLAYGVSTITTGDSYVFLSARDAFERAIELDPEFSLAYWELAIFWQVFLNTTNIVAGIIEMPLEEMSAQFNDAIDKAIEHAKDPVDKTRFRVMRANEQLKLHQALRLNTEYLAQRPNDRSAQNLQVELLADLQMDDRLLATIKEYNQRDGYDIFIAMTSMTSSLISDDKPFIRALANDALERFGDSVYAVYQAHRSLLWAGDIDGAARLLPDLQSSDLADDSLQLIGLRQACAENRVSDATRIYDYVRATYPDEMVIVWISHRLMNQDASAVELLRPLDETEDLDTLRDYMTYAYFDARPFPNLMAFLESQGVTPREPREIPYKCKI
jgi:TolB-like protein